MDWIRNYNSSKGYKIAKGTIIGAGSIVTKNFPEYSIIAGNPAKLIRKREVSTKTK